MDRAAEALAPSSILRRAGEVLLGLPRVGAWLLCAGWYGGITWLSARPGDAEPSPWWLSVLSNGAHAPLFGLLACWLTLLLPRSDGWPHLDRSRRMLVCTVIALCGAVDEWHQSHTPGRDMSVLDLWTDVAGAAISLELVAYSARRDGARRGLGIRLASAAGVSLACGALATFLPRCFPGVGWF